MKQFIMNHVLPYITGVIVAAGAVLVALNVDFGTPTKETPAPKKGEKYLFDSWETEINPFTADTIEINRVSRGFVEYSTKGIKWELENNSEALIDSVFSDVEVSEIRKYSISIEEFNKHSIKL